MPSWPAFIRRHWSYTHFILEHKFTVQPLLVSERRAVVLTYIAEQTWLQGVLPKTIYTRYNIKTCIDGLWCTTCSSSIELWTCLYSSMCSSHCLALGRHNVPQIWLSIVRLGFSFYRVKLVVARAGLRVVMIYFLKQVPR